MKQNGLAPALVVGSIVAAGLAMLIAQAGWMLWIPIAAAFATVAGLRHRISL